MTNKLQILRSATALARPTVAQAPEGSLFWNDNDRVLGISDMGGTITDLLPGVVHIGDTPPTTPIINSLWWRSEGVLGQLGLYVYYDDGDSQQWVQTNGSVNAAPATDAVLQSPASGVNQTITSADVADTPLTLNSPPAHANFLFRAQVDGVDRFVVNANGATTWGSTADPEYTFIGGGSIGAQTWHRDNLYNTTIGLGAAAVTVDILHSTSIGVIINAFTPQSVDILRINSSSGVTFVDQNGFINLQNTSGLDSIVLGGSSFGSATLTRDGFATVSLNTGNIGVEIVNDPASTTGVGMVIEAATGQSENLISVFQQGKADTLFEVTAPGGIFCANGAFVTPIGQAVSSVGIYSDIITGAVQQGVLELRRNSGTNPFLMFGGGAGVTANVQMTYNGAEIAQINTGTGAWVAISSKTVKTNIVSFVGTDTLMRLKPVHYNLIASGAPVHGFLAEDIAVDMPDAASLLEDGTPVGVDYNQIVALLVQTVQELKAEIDILKGAV